MSKHTNLKDNQIMAKKSKPFMNADILAMGFVETAPGSGVYHRAPKVEVKATHLFCEGIKFPAGEKEEVKKVKIKFTPPYLDITIPGIIPGLNGSKGLMRSHWTEIKNQKKLYCQIIRGQLNKHLGSPVFDCPVTIEYVGYKSCLMDWDNFCASGKHIFDSLVKCGVIIDDSPKIVKQFIPRQIKVKRSEQKVVITITSFKE